MAPTSNATHTNEFFPILHATSKEYIWQGIGALSIKTFKNGRSHYDTGHGAYAVDEGNYLLLNRGQDYTITIESDNLVESFCIFFPDGMVEEVYHSLVNSTDQLVDDPIVPDYLTIDFVEKTYCNDDVLARALCRMRGEYINNKNDRIWIEEKLHELLQNLLLVHREVFKEMERLPLLRASTRDEIYRRIQIGHDYISAYYNRPIRLADMAKAASLSPNHFLRNYKLLFGRSPHQFLTEKRLLEAKRLLINTDNSVTTICLDVGFQSVSSFSMLFSNHFSMSPSQFRIKK